MAEHPLNLAFRFGLELALLAAFALWGWAQGEGLARGFLAVLAPLVAAVLWGTFRVPGDGGEPIVAVPGVVRLLLELALFTLAVGALAAADKPKLAVVFAVLSLLHYALSFDRILSLIKG